jgi:hypothetical protein
MSYLDATVLNDFQANEATNEKRQGNFGMVDLATASTNGVDYIPPSVIEKLNTISASRDAKIPVMKDQSVTVTTSPGFTIPSNLSETDSYYFSPVDVFSGFRIYPASYENNQIDGAWEVEQRLRNVLQAMAVAKGDAIETILEARKTQLLDFDTQVSQGDGTFVFQGASDTLEINKAAQTDTMFPLLKELMQANKLGGEYSIVTSGAGLVSSVMSGMKNGMNQAEYLEWAQAFMPMENRHISDQLSPGSDNFTGFYVRNGAIGLYNNFPYDFRAGTAFAGKEWSISDVAMPYVNARLNVYTSNEATEATSIISPNTDSNLIMTHFKEMALWDRFYVVYRYNSDLTTRANDIVKIKGLTT